MSDLDDMEKKYLNEQKRILARKKKREEINKRIISNLEEGIMAQTYLTSEEIDILHDDFKEQEEQEKIAEIVANKEPKKRKLKIDNSSNKKPKSLEDLTLNLKKNKESENGHSKHEFPLYRSEQMFFIPITENYIKNASKSAGTGLRSGKPCECYKESANDNDENLPISKYRLSCMSSLNNMGKLIELCGHPNYQEMCKYIRWLTKEEVQNLIRNSKEKNQEFAPPVPLCFCNLICTVRKAKTVENDGRTFFTCKLKEKNSCKYFAWVDDILAGFKKQYDVKKIEDQLEKNKENTKENKSQKEEKKTKKKN